MKTILTCICSFVFLVSKVHPQSAGPFVPNNYLSSGTGADWGNLSGTQFVDNNPAYVDLAQYPTCNSFMCYRSNVASFSGFGFGVPLTAIITGVELNVMQKVSSPGGGIHDSILTLSMSNVAMGNNKANSSNWYDTPQTQTYGGASDMWGTSLTPQDINNSNFGILYEITNTSYDQTASVDFMTMTVYYQLGTSILSQSSSPFYVNFEDNSLMIRFQNSSKAKTNLNVYNSSGQLVYVNTYSTNSMEIQDCISTINWNNGIYFLQFESANGILFKNKLILLH